MTPTQPNYLSDLICKRLNKLHDDIAEQTKRAEDYEGWAAEVRLGLRYLGEEQAALIEELRKMGKYWSPMSVHPRDVDA